MKTPWIRTFPSQRELKEKRCLCRNYFHSDYDFKYYSELKKKKKKNVVIPKCYLLPAVAPHSPDMMLLDAYLFGKF